mmetsp:Transcript_84627/g.238034  ORF Transcript_84627/g.238034 Transcript_84627/m.238034 type:complete len:208 (+) Transcript_84627:1659-2282(+)
MSSAWICLASSRVGASASIRGFRPVLPSERPSATIRSTIGKQNAKVLPQPVFARPTVSLPARAGPKARCCTSSSEVKPLSFRHFRVIFDRPSMLFTGTDPLGASLSSSASAVGASESAAFGLAFLTNFCFFAGGAASSSSMTSATFFFFFTGTPLLSFLLLFLAGSPSKLLFFLPRAIAKAERGKGEQQTKQQCQDWWCLTRKSLEP